MCSNDTLAFNWTRLNLQLISDFFHLNLGVKCFKAEHVSKAEHASSTGVLEEEGGGATGFL